MPLITATNVSYVAIDLTRGEQFVTERPTMRGCAVASQSLGTFC